MVRSNFGEVEDEAPGNGDKNEVPDHGFGGEPLGRDRDGGWLTRPTSYPG